MNLNNFTLKSQESIQKAHELALGFQQQAIENAHVLKGILLVDENVTPFLLKKLGVNVNMFSLALDKIIESYPKVSGVEQFFSQGAAATVQRAVTLASKMKDDYVSIEHLLLAMLKGSDDASNLLKDINVASSILLGR